MRVLKMFCCCSIVGDKRGARCGVRIANLNLRTEAVAASGGTDKKSVLNVIHDLARLTGTTPLVDAACISASALAFLAAHLAFAQITSTTFKPGDWLRTTVYLLGIPKRKRSGKSARTKETQDVAANVARRVG